jgi:hypothetical protein
MMKVVINGETFEYDDDKMLMSEALWIEGAYGRRDAEYETERLSGEAKAMAVFCCAVWRRNGRDVDLEDVLEGKIDFDLGEVYASVAAVYAERAAAAKAAAENPTSGAAPLTDTDGTPTTSAATSERSPRSSASARGKSSG